MASELGKILFVELDQVQEWNGCFPLQSISMKNMISSVPSRKDDDALFLCKESKTIEQFMPRMPKTNEDLVQYWRVGCPSSLGIPVKNYHCPKFPKRNVLGCSDRKWRSGQRQLFERQTKLIKIVANLVDPPITEPFSENNREEYLKKAIEAFKNK